MIFTVFIILLNAHSYLGYPTLQLAHIITRHGDRSATKPYPGDPYQQTIWPQGTGQLTQEGMRQMYNLGLFIRQRYNGWLHESYDAHELYSRSTDLDRTLMSAEALLSAVFPPSGEQIWNEDIKWQPIPVHTEPRQDDTLLEMDILPCPRYNQLVQDTQESEAYHKENASFAYIYDYILPYSGYQPPLTPKMAWDVWDTLNTQRLNNYSLPSWVTEEVMTVIPEQLIPFQYRVEFASDEKMRLIGGAQLWQITHNMLDWISGALDRRMKVYLYSAHDDNIILPLMQFGLFYNRMIPYASALFIELYETSSNQFSVLVSLKNETNSNEVHNLTLPGCSELCSIGLFVTLTQNLTLNPEDHDKACQEVVTPAVGDLISIAVAIGVFLLLLLCILLVYYKPCRRKAVNKDYEPLA